MTYLYFSKAEVKLKSGRDLSVCVPGEYNTSCPSHYPTIASFHESLQVIPSKHRPRKLRITGSDGKIYGYVLKGNEDLRVDERVIQLFGLVNAFFHDRRRKALIRQFPVIPLSSSVGMLGWVEHSDTLQNIILNHRRLIRYPEKYEYTEIHKVCGGDFNSLTLLEKVDVFSTVLQQIPSNDIARSMWLQAPSAEVWLQRRTTYIESLAALSLVGYILGLGDRHLGNIMLKRSTGQIVHVDFGDCFDIARVRPLYPETVPFRLTPMLVQAMEVCGARGHFQHTSITTMVILRENIDSIVALLSAFLYDPILSLRFGGTTNTSTAHSPKQLVECMRAKLRGTEFNEPAVASTLLAKSEERLPCRPDIQFCLSRVVTPEKISLHSEQQQQELNLAASSRFNPKLGMTWSDTATGLILENKVEKAITSCGNNSVVKHLSAQSQVEELIRQATSIENLCALYPGWAPWW